MKKVLIVLVVVVGCVALWFGCQKKAAEQPVEQPVDASSPEAPVEQPSEATGQ